MLNAKTHFEQIPLKLIRENEEIRKNAEPAFQRSDPPYPKPAKKVLARHPKLHAKGGRP